MYACWVWNQTMRDMIEKMQDVLRKQCNACESFHKWSMKRLIGQESKNWKFSSFNWLNIDQASIERVREFWTQKLTVLIGRERFSIGRNS